MRIAAPASSANLGPGFDCLGLALDRWLSVDVTPTGDGAVRDGGSPDLLGGANLVIEAMQVTARRLGIALPGCEVRVTSDIPVARGLGSSAAAITAGIRVVEALADVPISDQLATDIGGAMEGHADNVSAAVYGGATVSFRGAAGYLAEPIASTLPWTPVVFIPDSHSMTHEARGILPPSIAIADAAANIGRAAMLVHALRTGRPDLLREAMQDRLHQPYRARIFPHLDPAIAAALNAGAHGAALSGAGPTVLALADPAGTAAVAAAMHAAAAAVGVAGEACVLPVAARGAGVVAGGG